MKSKLKRLALIFAAVGAVIFIGLLLIARPYVQEELLAVSEPDTVSLKWEFYACGNDCPYYRVTSVGLETNKRYQGRMADLRGYEWTAAGNPEDPKHHEAVFTAMWYDQLVCRGVFKQFSIPSFWECCLDGADNLAFTPMSVNRSKPRWKMFTGGSWARSFGPRLPERVKLCMICAACVRTVTGCRKTKLGLYITAPWPPPKAMRMPGIGWTR